MNQNRDPTGLADCAPELPKADLPHTRAYDCADCRYTDAHGLTCGFCMRKILEAQAEQRQRAAVV